MTRPPAQGPAPGTDVGRIRDPVTSEDDLKAEVAEFMHLLS
jgi:hypothetical protein